MQESSGETKKIWTVSELNRSARDLLGEHFSALWVEGEVSNFRLYPSGHAYFSLKDEEAQIAAVMFRLADRKMKFEVRDGVAVLARGELTIYDRRGQYQLVVEELEPRGKGALHLAFEQLKERLAGEGLFDEERKKPLPLLPRKVGIVTSPSGAAIRDVINVLKRRFSTIGILLNPVRVQGEGAAAEIAAAIEEFNRMSDVDVLIVGRGGGSIEDLWAFNEEPVARAIAASRIPVVSAVGHETDFTIADFAADLRAPTPSAAAELVVRNKERLEEDLDGLVRGLSAALSRRIEKARSRLDSLAVHRMVSDMQRRLREMAQESDGLHLGLQEAVGEITAAGRRFLEGCREALLHLSPRARQAILRERSVHFFSRLESAMGAKVRANRERALRQAARLEALSPLAVLSRGYSICRRWPSREVLKDARQIEGGEEVNVRLHSGEIRCRVTGTFPEGEADPVDS